MTMPVGRIDGTTFGLFSLNRGEGSLCIFIISM